MYSFYDCLCDIFTRELASQGLGITFRHHQLLVNLLAQLKITLANVKLTQFNHN